jgi:large subunit ribosomal protein L19
MEVEIHQIIKEDANGKEGGKERVQKYKWLVILTAWKSSLEKTITVRRKIGAFGVEKVFAIHSPTIQKIDILRQFKIKRKSIKFIRDLTGKAARLREVQKIAPIIIKAEEKAIPKKTTKKEKTTEK